MNVINLSCLKRNQEACFVINDFSLERKKVGFFPLLPLTLSFSNYGVPSILFPTIYNIKLDRFLSLMRLWDRI